jgi:hypothetical protein
MTSTVSYPVGIAAITVNLVAIAVWLLVVREPWVKSSANQYAFQLFQAAVTMAGDSQATRVRRSKRTQPKPGKRSDSKSQRRRGPSH